MTILGSGAEAIVHLVNDVVIKTRIHKEYRLPQLDERLRESRTRREGKVLVRLQQKSFPCPSLLRSESSELQMSLIPGSKLRDCLHENPAVFGKEIGNRIAEMHEAGIVHGDLTTSNMILHDKVYVIDFGLSFFSDKDEDRACDLHVLRQVLESTHHLIFLEVWNAVLTAYAKWPPGEGVLKRLEVVEKRGRNKKSSA